MTFVTGEVVYDPSQDPPFRVVFKKGSEPIGGWAVESEEQGEQEIIDALRELGRAKP